MPLFCYNFNKSIKGVSSIVERSSGSYSPRTRLPAWWHQSHILDRRRWPRPFGLLWFHWISPCWRWVEGHACIQTWADSWCQSSWEQWEAELEKIENQGCYAIVTASDLKGNSTTKTLTDLLVIIRFTMYPKWIRHKYQARKSIPGITERHLSSGSNLEFM